MAKKQSNIESFFTKGPVLNDIGDKDAVTNVDPKEKQQSEISSTSRNFPLFSPSSSAKRKSATDFQSPFPAKRAFNKQWLSYFEWLFYDEKNDLAMCKICQQVSSSNVDKKWINGFSGPFKKESFVWHKQSKTHCENVANVKAKTHPTETPIAKCLKTMDQQMFSHLKNIFNVAYYIAKHEKAFKDFGDLLCLAEKLNVDILTKYGNEKQCRYFIHFIAETLKLNLVEKLKKCTYISILIDGSTDRSAVEHANVYVRYVDIKDNHIKEDILGVVELANSTSAGYFTALTDFLDKTLGSNEYRNRCYIVGLGTDGAANMVGHKSGLAVKMKSICPKLINIHCLAHRLQLAVLDACGEVVYLKKFDLVVRSIFQFYHASSKRLHKLKDTAEILGEEILKLSDIHTIRWLSSKESAVRALLQSWKTVVTHLKQMALGKDNDSANAKGLLKSLTDYKFLKVLYFLRDFYRKLNPLSVALQDKELVISSLKIKTEHCISVLTNLESSVGPSEQEFLNQVSNSGIINDIQLTNIKNGEQEFQTVRKKLIKHAKMYITERLQSISTDLLLSLHIFDTLGWPAKEKILEFGIEDIKKLFMYLNPSLFDEKVDILLAEWAEFKFMFPSLTLKQMLEKCCSENCSERFPNLLQVLIFCAVLPVSTASCERGFSCHNRLKTAYRNSLKTETLDDLLSISINGPTLSEFDPTAAIDKWYYSAEKQRYTNMDS